MIRFVLPYCAGMLAFVYGLANVPTWAIAVLCLGFVVFCVALLLIDARYDRRREEEKMIAALVREHEAWAKAGLRSPEEIAADAEAVEEMWRRPTLYDQAESEGRSW